ncbi:TIGR00725 family protein [Actinomadura barringtoniae]|uniref:TIGR00725 family protein n=1 Tax=Actinomadura barringtoniae TaxID=1427535 RepID=A0A939PMC5_9ACTN|nr:TIGR00725 family protein [Actinomadura barringtoniae]MBO2455441.1 TIGR00725 family protein [Actinomadura barringtoniae]
MIQVSVCGPREATQQDLANAREIGRLLAERGAAVICGGYSGVMNAVAEGSASAGGLVIGILSQHTKTDSNPHLTVAIPTGIGEARNAIIALAGDAVIVVGGSWGTLSELALARRRGATVVQIGGWRISDSSGKPVSGVIYADTPEDVIDRTGLFA